MVGQRVATADGITVIAIGPSECARLARLIEPLLAAGQRSFVIDLAGVEFLTSIDIAALITLRNKTVAAGGRFVLADLAPRLREIFRTLKLQRLFDLDLDLAAAREAARIA